MEQPVINNILLTSSLQVNVLCDYAKCSSSGTASTSLTHICESFWENVITITCHVFSLIKGTHNIYKFVLICLILFFIVDVVSSTATRHGLLYCCQTWSLTAPDMVPYCSRYGPLTAPDMVPYCSRYGPLTAPDMVPVLLQTWSPYCYKYDIPWNTGSAGTLYTLISPLCLRALVRLA